MVIAPDGSVSFLPPPAVVVAEPPVVMAAPPPPPLVVEGEMGYGEGEPFVVAGYNEPFYYQYVGGEKVLVGFVGGVWINEHGGRVIRPEGGWHHPPRDVIERHRAEMRNHPERFHRMDATRGRGEQTKQVQRNMAPKQPKPIVSQNRQPQPPPKPMRMTKPPQPPKAPPKAPPKPDKKKK